MTLTRGFWFADQVHQEIAGCLCRPRAVGVGGDAGQVNAAGAVLDDEQGVDTT